MLANLMSITLNSPTEIGLIGLLVHRIDRLTVTDRVEQPHTVAWPRARKQTVPASDGSPPAVFFLRRPHTQGRRQGGGQGPGLPMAPKFTLKI